MTIQELANQNRLRYRLDECHDPIISGKFGHLYAHNQAACDQDALGLGQFGACVDHPVKSRIGMRAMRSKLRQMEALCGSPRQIGDSEGTWVLPLDFGPESPLWAQVLKILRIRKIRKATGRPFVKRPA